MLLCSWVRRLHKVPTKKNCHCLLEAKDSKRIGWKEHQQAMSWYLYWDSMRYTENENKTHPGLTRAGCSMEAELSNYTSKPPSKQQPKLIPLHHISSFLRGGRVTLSEFRSCSNLSRSLNPTCSELHPMNHSFQRTQ